MNVTISRGEVQGLELLRKISAKGELICTNQHSLTGFKSSPERSCAYGALSERPVLIEGWQYAGLENTPGFEKVFRENELVFTSSQLDLVKAIIEKYRIKYVVVRPGTILSIASNLPNWLKEIQNAGSLKIYHVANEDN
jgi:hypothetical protein